MNFPSCAKVVHFHFSFALFAESLWITFDYNQYFTLSRTAKPINLRKNGSWLISIILHSLKLSECINYERLQRALGCRLQKWILSVFDCFASLSASQKEQQRCYKKKSNRSGLSLSQIKINEWKIMAVKCFLSWSLKFLEFSLSVAMQKFKEEKRRRLRKEDKTIFFHSFLRCSSHNCFVFAPGQAPREWMNLPFFNANRERKSTIMETTMASKQVAQCWGIFQSHFRHSISSSFPSARKTLIISQEQAQQQEPARLHRLGGDCAGKKTFRVCSNFPPIKAADALKYKTLLAHRHQIPTRWLHEKKRKKNCSSFLFLHPSRGGSWVVR